MKKHTLIIGGIVLALIIGGTILFIGRGPTYQKESLTIEQDLTPIELSQEEEVALQDEGVTLPQKEDIPAKDLQSVRSSDEIDAINADIIETDLEALDAELDAITNDLLGL